MPRFTNGVCWLPGLAAGILLGATLPSAAQEWSTDHIEWFEKKIRPVLVEHCYRCHNSTTKSAGGLVLDHRAGLMEGGNSGPAVLPGRAAESLLLRVIRHEIDGLRMPKGGPPLDESVAHDVARWINDGAADPRDQAPAADELERAISWETIRAQRASWWSFLPVNNPQAPQPANAAWSEHPVDHFLLAAMEEAGLQPVGDADRRPLIRRLSFVLHGMPPAPEEVDEFVSDKNPDAYERLVERMLASPRYGERWARHWMDWFRYADSHGSEGDPTIPHAWRYRDYLIRAFNADVDYPQLVREHLAGDLLEGPRIDPVSRRNESALGVGHFRFVQHGFAPTDALDELVRFTDNQIDVVTKTCLGMTVSCARCHDHKFDPIGQDDYYALFGVLASCRPGLLTIDTPEHLAKNSAELAELKPQIRAELAATWLAELDDWPASLLVAPRARSEPQRQADQEKDRQLSPWQLAIDAATGADLANPLFAWTHLQRRQEDGLATAWQELVDQWKASAAALEFRRPDAWQQQWKLSDQDYADWFPRGQGLADGPTPAGTFAIEPEGDRVLAGIYPAGVYTHLLSSKHNGVLNSPRFEVDCDDIWLRVMGSDGARLRYVIQNYPRDGTVYPTRSLNDRKQRWVRLDTRYWRGDHAHLEIATAGDLPVGTKSDERSWFGITEVICRQPGEPLPSAEAAETVTPLFGLDEPPPADMAALARRYGRALRECVQAWRDGTLDDAEARFLDYFVRQRLLTNDLESLPSVTPLIAAYRALEADVPTARRAPGIWESAGFDQPLFVRGNHRQPANPVPRRLLAVLGGPTYGTSQSGRLELADDVLRADNPLTYRVIANRVWHHVFGVGIVPTPDNFGRLGRPPTHPALLDYLASHFKSTGGSLRETIRMLVTTRTFRQRSVPSRLAARIDPDNQWLSHANLRRLEAEAIRDALLSVSRQLDAQMFGPSVAGKKPRRSIYVQVFRNRLDPLLSAFDAPPPITTKGRRDATNVPAQSLALLNDPQVIDLAGHWAEAVLSDPELADTASRIDAMFRAALGRAATADEIESAEDFLAALAAERADTGELAGDQGDPPAHLRTGITGDWQTFAQTMFTLKEFIYLP